MEKQKIETRVIKQFGDQWTRFPENAGYYGSSLLFEDILGPLACAQDFAGKAVAEIGSGSGRVVKMLLATGAAKVVAVEPSEAMTALKTNTAEDASRIVYLRERGESWAHPGLDYVVSFGVLHHIFDPAPVVAAAMRNLKPGGKFIVWLYGREGNELYLALATPLRALTTRLSDTLLELLSRALLPPLNLYARLCRLLPLPMRAYMLDHFGRLDHGSQLITVYDQLNPTWAKYYRRHEAESLLREGGFADVRVFHRHGYSWTIVGTKPAS